MISRTVLSVMVVGMVAIWWTDVSRAGTTTAPGLESTGAPSTAAAASGTTAAGGAAAGGAAGGSYTASTAAGGNVGMTNTQAAGAMASNYSTAPASGPIMSTAKNVAATGAAVTQAPAAQSNTSTVTPITCWQSFINAGNSSLTAFNVNVTDTCTSNNGICYALYDAAANTASFGCTGTSKTCSQNDITKTGSTAAGNQCEFCCTSGSCDDIAKLSYESAKTTCTKLIAQLRNGIDPMRPTTSAISLLASLAAVTVVLLL